jgi:hypothetical protein
MPWVDSEFIKIRKREGPFMSPYRVIATRNKIKICQRVFGTYAKAVEHARKIQEDYDTMEIPMRA